MSTANEVAMSEDKEKLKYGIREAEKLIEELLAFTNLIKTVPGRLNTVAVADAKAPIYGTLRTMKIKLGDILVEEELKTKEEL